MTRKQVSHSHPCGMGWHLPDDNVECAKHHHVLVVFCFYHIKQNADRCVKRCFICICLSGIFKMRLESLNEWYKSTDKVVYRSFPSIFMSIFDELEHFKHWKKHSPIQYDSYCYFITFIPLEKQNCKGKRKGKKKYPGELPNEERQL